jgi:hypothetical protein
MCKDRASSNGKGQGHTPIPPTEWGPLELIRARRVVEGEIAALAAVQAKRKDTDAMARAIDAMQRDADRNVMPLDGDRAFPHRHRPGLRQRGAAGDRAGLLGFAPRPAVRAAGRLL